MHEIAEINIAINRTFLCRRRLILYHTEFVVIHPSPCQWKGRSNYALKCLRDMAWSWSILESLGYTWNLEGLRICITGCILESRAQQRDLESRAWLRDCARWRGFKSGARQFSLKSCSQRRDVKSRAQWRSLKSCAQQHSLKSCTQRCGLKSCARWRGFERRSPRT